MKGTGQMTDKKKAILEKRLDATGWGLFLVMMGCLLIIPEVHGTTWLFGAGVIILLISWIKYFYKIKVSVFWVILGILAVGGAVVAWLGANVPALPALLIIAGLGIIFKIFYDDSGLQHRESK